MPTTPSSRGQAIPVLPLKKSNHEEMETEDQENSDPMTNYDEGPPFGEPGERHELIGIKERQKHAAVPDHDDDDPSEAIIEPEI